MKKIVITENQAKKLVGVLISEQTTQGEKRYDLSGLSIIIKDGNPYYVGKDGLRYDLPKLSEIKVAIYPSDKEIPYRFYKESPAFKASELVIGLKKPRVETPVGPGFEAIVFDDLTENIPMWVKINVMANVPASGPIFGDPKMIKQKEFQAIEMGVTRTRDFALSVSNPLVSGVSVDGGNTGRGTESVFFCLTYDNGIKKVRELKKDADQNFVKSLYPEAKKIEGPFKTREEADRVCSKPELPELQSFGDYFANNVSKVKLSPSMEFIKKLQAYFDAGGKLSKITIKASASKVPAGHVEGDDKALLWKETKTYDNAAIGNNDDDTGNLQLTKARASNLYNELTRLVPALIGVEKELIALGSIGDPYKSPQKPKPGQDPKDPSLKGDDRNDPKYANFRRVDLLLSK